MKQNRRGEYWTRGSQVLFTSRVLRVLENLKFTVTVIPTLVLEPELGREGQHSGNMVLHFCPSTLIVTFHQNFHPGSVANFF